MKTLIVFFAVAIPICATVNAAPPKNKATASSSKTVTPTKRPATKSNAPRLVIPAKGGPPVLAIPLGGGLYQPVKGGMPVPGTPVSK